MNEHQKRKANAYTSLDANQEKLSARFTANPALANAQFVAMYFPSSNGETVGSTRISFVKDISWLDITKIGAVILFVLMVMFMHLAVVVCAFVFDSSAVVGVPGLVFNLVFGSALWGLVAAVAAADRKNRSRWEHT